MVVILILGLLFHISLTDLRPIGAEESISPVVSPPKPSIDELISSMMQEPVFGMDDSLSNFAESRKDQDRGNGKLKY